MLMKLITLFFVLVAARFIYIKLISPGPGAFSKPEKKEKDSKFDTDNAVDADYKEVQ